LNNFFFTILIEPLIYIYEFIFVLFYKFSKSVTLPLIGISFFASFLSLPLYIMAEKWQKIERLTIKSLEPKIAKIKSVFKNDEKFMILSTYYRQNNYHPIYSLRNSISVLIQIPFFIAAYYYITNLTILSEIKFLFISDLSKPDNLFIINNFSINTLPIIMTIINLISGIIYTKDLYFRDKIQIYGISIIFLIILYNSPSALVIYWTFNNLFSLVKNIFYKIKNPKKILYIISSLIVTLINLYMIFFMQTRSYKKRLLIGLIISIIYFLPIITQFIKIKIINNSNKLYDSRNITLLFILSCIILLLLTGLYIPSIVISSSPDEFSFINNYQSPFIYILHSFLFYFGFFVIWPISIFYIFPSKYRIIFTYIMCTTMVLSSIFTLLFSGNSGIINNTFNFITTDTFNISSIYNLLSILSFILLIVLITIIFHNKKIQIINSLVIILGIVLISTFIYNSFKINKRINYLSELQKNNQSINTLYPIFTLSKTEKNIIIIMADGSVNGFIPLIFNENPYLYDQYNGFTLYRNTASFASHTIMGVPPIWGGYENTPYEINSRNNDKLVEKHNEALLTLPILLTKAGFNVTVTDPSWANYSWIPDTSIYNNYENITAFNTEGRYTGLWYSMFAPQFKDFTQDKILRNSIWFSFLKITIPFLRYIIYDNGWYWNTENIGFSFVDFINAYSVLDYISDLTSFDSLKSSALLITNELTHKDGYIDPLDLRPSEIINKIGNGEYANDTLYHTNTALLVLLGKWFEFLKANDVYNNSRIIIVADHGSDINNLISEYPLSIEGENKEKYNPILMVKDFNNNDKLEFNDSFMTNADVPAIALKDLLENPVNPFSGNPINMDYKNNGIFITTCHLWMADKHGKYQFNIKNNQWIHLQNSIFDSSNWVQIEK